MDSKRRLAVIMFTDIVGYTALMGRDEKRALSTLRENKQIHQDLLKRYHGHWLKEMGDGVLASFETISDAVYCAGALLVATKGNDDLNLRIGIHLGEVTVEGEEFYGDGVNVASRIEGIADSGQLLVSETIYRNMRNKEGVECTYLGEHQLKNVDEPVKVYAVQVESIPEEYKRSVPLRQTRPRTSKILLLVGGIAIALILLVYLYIGVPSYTEGRGDSASLPPLDLSKADLSVAVLPFENRSGLLEDLYFTDGMQDELRTRLAKVSGLTVLSRNSVMDYRNSTKTSRAIGNELGVGYLLGGSVQRSNDRVRIYVSLSDTKNDQQVWAESYDRQLTAVDLLNIQSDIARTICGELGAVISTEESKRIALQSTTNLQAYDAYLRAFTLSNLMVEAPREDMETAIVFYDKATTLDPGFALAYAMVSDIHSWFVLRRWDRSDDRKQAASSAADRALALALDLPEAHYAKAAYHYRVEKDYDQALESLRLAETGLRGEGFLALLEGYIHRRAGHWQEAISALERAMKLDPRSDVPVFQLAITHRWLRQYDRAAQLYQLAFDLNPSRTWIPLQMAEQAIHQTGRFDAYQALRSASQGTLDGYWYDLFLQRRFAQLLEVAQVGSLQVNEWQDGFEPISLWRGWTYAAMGDDATAGEYFKEAVGLLDAKARTDQQDDRVHRALGLAYAGLGRREAAIQHGDRALQLVPPEKEAYSGPFNLEGLAMIYAQLGEAGPAVQALRKLFSIPGPHTIHSVMADPRYDPIRDSAEYLALVASLDK